MATSTDGGTINSFLNSPQAVDDYYCITEDCIYTFDVMGNDLGGNAKILWSIDDTCMKDDSGTGTYDLLQQDAACVPELSDLGARIWIESGKIRYDAGVFNYLGAGEKVTDQFTYAIRLSNGTLSWATVTIDITGTNDRPDIRVGSGDTGNAGLNETDAGLCKTGTLTVTDPDNSDTVSTTFVLTNATGPAGGPSNTVLESMFSVTPATGLAADNTDTNNLAWKFDSGSEAFNYLRAGQTLQLVYTLTVNDGHGGTDTQTVTLTITGTNDAPVLSDTTDPAAVLELGNASAQNLSPITGSFSVTDLDVGDTLTPSVVGGPVVQLNGGAFVLPAGAMALTAAGAFTLDPAFLSSGGAQNVGYSYDPGAANLDFLRAGDSLTITYTIQIGDGTTNSGTQNVTFTITGTNDAPVLTGDLAATVDEGGTYQLTTADVNFTDPDDGAGDVTFTATGLSNGTLYVNGIAQNTFTGAELSAGLVTFTHDGSETLTAGFNISVEDGNEDASAPLSQPFNFTVTPVNDAPVNSVPAGQAVDEDQALVFSNGNGNAISINDVDAGSNTVQVTLSVASGTLTLGSLVGLSVTAGANGTSTVTVQGTQAAINTALQGLTYLGNLNFNGGDSLSIVTSDLGNSGSGGTKTDSDSVTITVNAVNDAPVNTLPASYSTNENTALKISGLSVADVDAGAGNISVTLSVASGTLTAANGGGVTVSGSGTGSIILSGTLAAINAYLSTVVSQPTFTPVANTSGDVPLTMTTSDLGNSGSGGAQTDIDIRTISVVDVSAPPTDITFTLAASTGGLAGNQIGSGATLGSFSAVDPDSNSWTFTIGSVVGQTLPAVTVNPASGGSVNLVTNGAIASGNYQFTVTATDAQGQSYTETYTLSVGTAGDNLASFFTITSGTDLSFGLNGGDTINGGAGDDALVGGQGNDTLNGGLGNDQLIGGAGGDIFLFNTALNSSTNVDRILDFDAGGGPNGDHIHLDDAIFTQLTAGALSASNFASNAGGNATDANDFILFDTLTGNLYYDPDGNGAGAKILIATITVASGTIDPTDILIV